MKQFLIIQLFFYFGWLSCIAVAQLEISSAITGSASFPHVGITCLGNLAVFITSFIRKRLDLEMAAREFLATITGPCKFKEITDPCKFKEMQEITGTEQKGKVPDEETGACRFKENNKHELIAVTTGYLPVASVVMLTNSAGMTNSSIRQFMQYIFNAHNVHSVLLKYVFLKDSTEVRCNESGSEEHNCNCIVISKVERINMPQVPKELLESQVPKELPESQVPQVPKEFPESQVPQVPKEFPESLVVLPSLQCLENECHGCKRDLLHVEVIKNNLNVEFSSAVCDALDFEFATPTQKEPICICIPVNDDKWTTLLVRFLKYKDQEDKGAIVEAADALKNYLDKRGEDRTEKRAEGREVRAEGRAEGSAEDRAEGRAEGRAEDRAEGRAEDIAEGRAEDIAEGRAEDRAEGRAEDRDDRAEEIKYKTVSLIVIRLVEIFVNLLLTVFFKVDGFSSALAARRAVRSYVVDSKGNGLPANVFLTSALVVVKSHSVCQVLKFRGNILFWLMLLSTFFVNLLCAIAWAGVLIARNGGIGKWYAVPSIAPSKPRVALIIAAICIGIVMDCFELSKRTLKEFWIIKKKKNQYTSMILGVIILEIVFAVVGGLGLNKGIGRWVYGALQLLVWVKWLFGSFILGAYSPEYVSTRAKRKTRNRRAFLDYSSAQWVDEGSLVYCSSFFLNAVMVGVMGDWAGIWSTWK